MDSRVLETLAQPVPPSKGSCSFFLHDLFCIGGGGGGGFPCIGLHAPCLVRLFVGSLYYTPRAACYMESSTTRHVPFYVWLISVPRPMLFHLLVWDVSLHNPSYVMWGVSLTRPVLFYVGSFSYTTRARLCAEFLLHAVCLGTFSYSYTLRALLCGDFLAPFSLNVGSFF